MDRPHRQPHLSHRARAARERDAALTRVAGVRVWAVGGAGALSLFFAALAHALAPGHKVARSTPPVDTNAALNVPADTGAPSNSSTPASPSVASNSSNSAPPQAPAQAPTAPAAPAPSPPVVVGGGS